MTAAVQVRDDRAPDRSEHQVGLVLVSHDGARWLTDVLAAIASQTRPADALVAVDTGSTDDTVAILQDRLEHAVVLRLPADAGFGAAVASGAAHLSKTAATTDQPTDRAGRTDWLWILHDDSAPAPDALGRLLEQAADDVALIGPKSLEWPQPRRLLEVGVTLTGTGRRETGLEQGERDQGQHDRPRDVLAVGSAGMLVRRDVWDQLGGFEPSFRLYGEDLDLGWRVARAGWRTRVAPAAVVFHVAAAERGLRTSRAVRGRARFARRRSSLITLLANAGTPGFCWQLGRLLVGSLLRALALLLAKAPGEAAAELRALGSVYGRLGEVLAARRRRRATAVVPARSVRHLLPSPWLPYRHGLDALAGAGAAFVHSIRSSAGVRRAVAETGPVADEAEDLPSGPGLSSRLRAHPWAGTVVLLLVLSVWSARHLLGGGQLSGGALLPAPDGVGGWLHLAFDPWHPVGLGSDRPAAPYVLFLALSGALTLGQPWLLVDLLVLGAPLLAALSAHRLARRLFGSERIRIWWSATYGLLPVASVRWPVDASGPSSARWCCPWPPARPSRWSGAPAGELSGCRAGSTPCGWGGG